MTSNSTPGNFNLPKVPILKPDDEIIHRNRNYKFLCLDDAHINQDLQALADLQNPINQALMFQKMYAITATGIDKNLLTNTNFKSINDNNSQITYGNAINTNSDIANSVNPNSAFIGENFNTTSTNENQAKFACKSRKLKHPQLDNTIAKKIRTKTPKQSTTKSAPIIKSKIRSQKSKRINQKNKPKSIQRNNPVSNISQAEKNCPQINTVTNTELKETNPNINKNLNLNKTVREIKKLSRKNNGGNTELISKLNEVLKKCIQSEEFADSSILGSEKQDHENTGYSRDVTLTVNEKFQNREQLETIPNLNKNVLDSEKETNENTSISKEITLPLKMFEQSEDTVIDITFQLDEFEKMVNDFKTIVVNKLKTKPTNSKTLLKESEGLDAKHEEEIISEMENDYKLQFNNEDFISNEEMMIFASKIPKWEMKVSKFVPEVSNN